MKSNKIRVAIVGSGGVAEAFARNIARNERLHLCGIIARNGERGMHIAELCSTKWHATAETCEAADIYVIAVSDSAVEGVAQRLHVAHSAIVVHTAGSVPLSAIPEREGKRGIVYPFQTFTKGRDIDLSHVTLFLEADNEATLQGLKEFASLITRNVEYANSERRRTIHLAGVFVNNFTNHLYALGRDIVGQEGLDFEVLKPLIAETAAKALAGDDPREAQTGPAKRGDRGVIEKHMAMLNEDSTKQKIYNDITESIWETSKRI